MISCGARLAPFDIPQLREIMSYDELELDKLGDEKSALFFLISDTDTTYNFLVALAFSQMFNLLCERADNTYGGRLPYHVRVLWDEAANTGQVPGLEKIVAVIRSREISLTLFYQAMSQCKALYKDHSETIMGNMDSIVFLGGREASTLKDISENWLGKATISMQTEGRSRGQSESYSQNTQRLGRELMTTSEITTMPGDKCILQLRGLPPFLSPKYDLKKHPNYKYTAEFDKKKNAFRLESLFRHRPLRLKPEDEYTVYEVDGSDTDEEADLLNFDDLEVLKMKILLKILVAPFALALSLLAALLVFLFDICAVLLTIASVILAVLGVALFFTPTPIGGIVFLFLAFLLSPYGLQAAAGSLLWALDGGKSALYRFLAS